MGLAGWALLYDIRNEEKIHGKENNKTKTKSVEKVIRDSTCKPLFLRIILQIANSKMKNVNKVPLGIVLHVLRSMVKVIPNNKKE